MNNFIDTWWCFLMKLVSYTTDGRTLCSDTCPMLLFGFVISAVFAGPFRTERDATNWSSDKLKSLILGLSVENEEGSCEVTEVSKLEGEASINNRKGKLIFFYEWTLKAAWTGKMKTRLFVGLFVCLFVGGGGSFVQWNWSLLCLQW